jgi:hypothetical protein
MSPGAVKLDSGSASWCCWSSFHVVRDGATLDLNNPEMTLAGKNGTLVTRNRIVWMDLPDGSSIFTGTWKVVKGTGAYAGLTGGGFVAGINLQNGHKSAQYTGFLNPK